MAEWTTPSAIHSKCGEDAASPATNTIDENTTTYWRHSSAELHWIIFDMGETKTITKIRLYQRTSLVLWGGDTGLYVYVSDDPADFGDAVWEGILNTPSSWNESGAFSKNGRYIKLLTKFGSSSERMYEFDAYAEAVGPPPAAVKPVLMDGLVVF